MDFEFIRPNNPRFAAQCFLISFPILHFLRDMKGYEKFIIYIVAIIIAEVLVRKFFPNYVKYFNKFKKHK
jgi:hypothetical protein